MNEEKKSQKTIKKPPAKLYKEQKRKVEAIIDVELKKKIEKAESLSKDKKDGVKKEKKVLTLIKSNGHQIV